MIRGRSATGVANVVSFEVGGVLYALDIQRVQGIIKPVPVHRLPHLPQDVVGVADYRGDVVPVIDLRVRFGLAAADDSSVGRWIIVRRGARLVAFVVDRVVEVCDTARLERRETPAIVHGNDARGIVAAHAYGKRLIFQVDAEAIAAGALELDTRALGLALAAPVGEHGSR